MIQVLAMREQIMSSNQLKRVKLGVLVNRDAPFESKFFCNIFVDIFVVLENRVARLKDLGIEVDEQYGFLAICSVESNKGSPGMRWPFLNKVSAVPHLMSFKAAQDEKTKKVSEPIVSSGLTHIPVADAYDSSRRRTVVEVQVIYSPFSCSYRCQFCFVSVIVTLHREK